MSTYKITLTSNNILKVKFNAPAQNNQIVQDAYKELTKLIEAGDIKGGKIIKINGPASMPVAMVISHKLAHLYQTIACYDPKLAKYVVVITHGSEYALGELID